MNYKSVFIPQKRIYDTGVAFIDKHINIGEPRIISVCGDNDMVWTSMLHLMAERAAMAGRPVWFVNAAGDWNPHLYGMTDNLCGGVWVLLTNSADVFLEYSIERIPENALVLYDNLGISYGLDEPRIFQHDFYAVCDFLKKEKRATVVFSEYYSGVTGLPLSSYSNSVDYRINIRYQGVASRKPFDLELHRLTCLRGAKGTVLGDWKLRIPRGPDYHKALFDSSRRILG